MKKIILLLFVALMGPLSAIAKPGEALRAMPIQDGGRIKPFDSFSREMLEIVYGKTKYEKRAAYEIILTWMLSPEAWQGKKIFEVRNHQILKALRLNEEQRYFAGEELFANEKFGTLRQELQAKRQAQEKLDPYFQAVQRLENQYIIFAEIASGRMMKLIPGKDAHGDWVAIPDFTEAQQAAFLVLTKEFVTYIGVAESGDKAKVAEAGNALDKAVKAFEDVARAANPVLYDHDAKIKAEIHYSDLHPFRVAYIFYLLGAMAMLLMWALSKPGFMKAAWILLSIGFIFHTYGFGLRMYLMDRAPVTNMYETVIWVSWGTLLFAAILERIYKFGFTLFAGALVGTVALVIADFAPTVLNPALEPLVAVLRSNYWLTIHVMTITISYAAFFLAFGLGDVGLIYYLRGEEKHHDKIKAIVLAIYRSMQIGVAFLAPGIILGGIWADYSWGRFWGWDPKETWALIALLGYLAVLHARLAGLIKNFGMIASGIITFSLVIMAWYGVNFVLGAGLHSYGFGAGGVEYVSAFVAVHILFVIYVAVLRRGKKTEA